MDVCSTRSALINLNKIARSYLKLHRNPLSFFLSGSFSRVVILALCPLCCVTATAEPANYIRQNSVTEALVPSTTKPIDSLQPAWPSRRKRNPCFCRLWSTWAPNGVQLLGGVQYSLLKQEGRIILMSLDDSVIGK